MNRHVEFRSDAEHALRCLCAKPVKWEVAQRRHFLLGSFLEGVSDGIKDFTDEFDAGGLEFKVLGGGGRRVFIGMCFSGSLTVGLLDFIGGRGGSDGEDFVGIDG